MNDPSRIRLVLFETSARVGQLGLADGVRVLARRRLDQARRHARDLAPMLQELLRAAGWRPAEVSHVFVSRGPGSYTGLRVGIMSAKTFAYATGCSILAIDTFALLAHQAGVTPVDVLSDAQQDRVYVQRFQLIDGLPQALSPMAVVPFAQWLAARPAQVHVTGPALETHAEHLAPDRLAAADRWLPTLESLHSLGLDRLSRGEQDDPLRVEPLYVRPSSAEEQWVKLGR